jgi:RimJ/RimL family protein N-acetyltransferase
MVVAQEAEPAYLFRPYIESDLNFIKSSWASSYYKGANYQDHLSPDEFHSRHRLIRDRILSKPNTAIIICASKELNPEIIMGWVLVERPEKSPGFILHYVYVKQAFKSEGIARELLSLALPQTPVLVTHLTEKASRIMANNKIKYLNFHFTPHLI